MSKTKKNKHIKKHRHTQIKKRKTKETKKNNKTNLVNTKINNSHHLNSHNTNYKLYDRKSDILKFQFTPKLRGGKFVDRGGFGCVITPALACSSSDTNLDNSVSKIIKHQSETLNKELKISNMLKKIDPKHNFYTTIDKYCFINNIPKNRTDLTNVKYKDNDLSDYTINSEDLLDINGKKKKIDKNFCDIDLDLKPINLIMPYAGLSLSSIMKTNRKSNGVKALMHQMFVNNLKVYFKHLIIGLLKMHSNRIVNKDIKQRNIMLKMDSNLEKNIEDKSYNKNNKDKDNANAIKVRYIDLINLQSNKANDLMFIYYILSKIYRKFYISFTIEIMGV
jgi:hypothetical protein